MNKGLNNRIAANCWAKRIFVFLLAMIALGLLAEPGYAEQSKLEVYGFFDMEAEVSNKDAAGKIWTFDQHHLNIITIYPLDNKFRVFAEVAWEHGPFYSPSEMIGNIYLARAYLEYKYSDAFQLRMGTFLTPFGIYNERHDATPTFISTFVPQSVYGEHELSFMGKGRLFAKHGTGVQVLGTLSANKWEGKYQLYLSNGMGPSPTERDNNANKGIGGRLIISLPIETLRLGASYYTDRNGDANNARQNALGFDSEFDYEDIHLETEVLLASLERLDISGAPSGDFRKISGYYLLGAYTFFDKLTPFARYEWIGDNIDKDGHTHNATTFGINYSITPSVKLKNEIQFRSEGETVNSYQFYVASIAVAF